MGKALRSVLLVIQVLMLDNRIDRRKSIALYQPARVIVSEDVSVNWGIHLQLAIDLCIKSSIFSRNLPLGWTMPELSKLG